MISCVYLSFEREQTLDFSAVAFGETGSLPGSMGRGTDPAERRKMQLWS